MASVPPSFSLHPRFSQAIPILHPSGMSVKVDAVQQPEESTPGLGPTPLVHSPYPNANATHPFGHGSVTTPSHGTTTPTSQTYAVQSLASSTAGNDSRAQQNAGQWAPDLYARPYTPLYLLSINRSYAVDRDCKPLSTLDFNEYTGTFAGSSILKPVTVQSMPHIQKPSISISRHCKLLTPSNYPYYFNECLLAETYNHSIALSHLKMYNVKMETYQRDQQLYSLKVPGLKDDAPRLDLGDIVLIRQIVPSANLQQQGAEWFYQNHHPNDKLIAPGFSGQQHRAIVWGLHRAKENVILRIDHFLPSLPMCNVIFQVQPNLYTPLWGAISRASKGYSMEWPGSDLAPYGKPAAGVENRDSWIRHTLFPDPEDGVMQTELAPGFFPHKWVDEDLNLEQMKAVDAVVSRDFGSVPYLISGVPGSGKTKTLVECALQLLRSPGDVEPHILICAPSNPAADTIAIRLSRYLSRHEMFRLNGYTRTFVEVPGKLLPYTESNGETFSLPPFKVMMKFKVVVTTCHDADMLVRARLTNADLLRLTFETVLPVAPRINISPEKALHWTTLIVDEAAQATEPAVCVPLTVVANPLAIKPSPEGKSALPVVVMAGDQHQLGPRVFNHDTALAISLFERLSSRPIYAGHPFSRRNAGRYKRLTKEMLPIPRAAFTNLTRNYRSHQSIIAIPSVLFYSDTLLPSAPPIHPLGPVPTWPEWKSRHKWPVLFACNTSPDNVEEILHSPAGSGLYNDGEALMAAYYAKSLLNHSEQLEYNEFDVTAPKRVKQEEIAVISPFNSQVTRLRNIFRSKSMHGVSIGPLKAFQGLETRFLIICTTRTRTDPRFVEQDQSLGLGLIGERKRFNMALTRAKEGVVVIGNPSLLGIGPVKDEVWHVFLSFCARNRCWAPEANATDSTEDSGHGNPAADQIDNGTAEARKSAEYWVKRLAGTTRTVLGQHSHPEADGDGDDLGLQSGYVSSLEYALLYDARVEREAGSGRQLGDVHTPAEDAQDAAMWLSGLAVEQVLREEE